MFLIIITINNPNKKKVPADGHITHFREQLTRFYHKESSSLHPAIVPIEGAVLFELLNRKTSMLDKPSKQEDKYVR
jgi:hypothetical protein